MRAACGLCALLLATACEDGQRLDPGLDAGLHVRGGTFVREALPQDEGGPSVHALYLGQRYLSRGQPEKPFSGVLDANATAAAIALVGDRGYWLVPSGLAFPESPESTSFDAPLSFSGQAAAGPHQLLVAAIDERARFGPARAADFTLSDVAVPSGELVFSLFWDTESDLDLHVVMPDGTEIYRDEPNSWEPPLGTQPGPEDWKNGGILDFDSNASCVIDGRRNENVVFRRTAPAGTYSVRVDAFSLCNAPAARFSVEVRAQNERLATVSGELVPGATRFPHGPGAGLRVLDVSVSQ